MKNEERKGSTAAFMFYQALFTARNTGIFTAELHGITGEIILQFGGVVRAWGKDQRNVLESESEEQVAERDGSRQRIEDKSFFGETGK